MGRRHKIIKRGVGLWGGLGGGSRKLDSPDRKSNTGGRTGGSKAGGLNARAPRCGPEGGPGPRVTA